MQCADYIGANASRDVASKFICSGMILPRGALEAASPFNFKRPIHNHEYCWPWMRTGPGGLPWAQLAHAPGKRRFQEVSQQLRLRQAPHRGKEARVVLLKYPRSTGTPAGWVG